MWKQSEVKEKIVEIVNELMKNVNIELSQLDDDLVEFGLDSIIFVQLIVEIEEVFQVDVPDKALYISELNTINKITKLVEILLLNIQHKA